ncbi:MAG: lactate racemase domain-containing protein [Acidimicrobiales bacterium]
MRQVAIEYGRTTVEVDLPDGSLVISPKDHVDPPPVDPQQATREALNGPVGLPPLRQLVHPGSRVAIAFPDRVKGGSHAQAHRKVALPLILEELAAGGVDDDDIHLVCAVGLHRKNTVEEMTAYLPGQVIKRWTGRLVNHDAEDPDGVIDLGRSSLGDVVTFNRTCAEADVTVVLGHVQGNPYGGLSGGHKTATTGLTTWRSIAGHHGPATMHRPDFVPISTDSHFRHQLRAIGQQIQSGIGHPLYAVDAVIGKGSTILGTFAGAVDDVEQASWPLARRRTNVEVETEPADVLLFGLPRDFHYGPGMGTNPILMAQATASVIARCAGLLRPEGVAIVFSECDGWFNDDWFPSYRETFERWNERRSVEEMGTAIDDIATRPEYIDAYRFKGGYHPFHGFSMLSMAAIGLQRTARILIVGAKAPGWARAMGFEPVVDFDAALVEAKRHVGATPRLVALPRFLLEVPPHLFATRS